MANSSAFSNERQALLDSCEQRLAKLCLVGYLNNSEQLPSRSVALQVNNIHAEVGVSSEVDEPHAIVLGQQELHGIILGQHVGDGL
mmetsp:Transcript_37980/g.105690  ORF Transcript_37980/g.105690 Transcript_37980/m.105690 type:complete len:86 (+) Transcript_37980:46-303(+)